MKKRRHMLTNWTGIFVIIGGYLEANMHILKDLLGDNYPYAFVTLGLVMILLREKTHRQANGT